jgi:hypothetical protein
MKRLLNGALLALVVAAASGVIATAASAGVVLAATGRAAADTSLNPPPPDFLTCKAVGSGTICDGTRTISYGPDDSGLVCGSGASAFDIFDSGTFNQYAIRYYDTEGNLTRRRIHDYYTFGEWSNPLTGKVVSYTQNNLITDVLAVPGDFTSSTQTVTGENIYRAGAGAPVFIATGRQVWNFDESVLISSAGRNGFVAAFFEGDATAFDALCAALA